MADQRFELSPQGIPLDPIDHETAVAGTRCDAVVCVDVIEVIPDIFPALDQVVVGVAPCDGQTGCMILGALEHTPVVLDCVGQFVSKSCTSCRVWRNHHISLIGKDLGVPSRAPRVEPCSLGTSVD